MRRILLSRDGSLCSWLYREQVLNSQDSIEVLDIALGIGLLKLIINFAMERDQSLSDRDGHVISWEKTITLKLVRGRPGDLRVTVLHGARLMDLDMVHDLLDRMDPIGSVLCGAFARVARYNATQCDGLVLNGDVEGAWGKALIALEFRYYRLPDLFISSQRWLPF